MGLDLRWPIGLMFSLIGVLLVGYGLLTASNSEIYARSLGINIDLYWGLLLTAFGATMLTLAWRGTQKDAATPTPKEPEKSPETAARR